MTTGRDSSLISQTLAEIGEFGLLSELLAGLPTSENVVIGAGDDAAAVAVQSPVLACADVMVEGVHFRRDWSSAEQVGRKVVASNLSDIEAMGGKATALLVCFSAPPDLSASWAKECLAGMLAEASEYGAVIVGGDTTSSKDITIAVTALGQCAGEPVTRSGAQPGDQVAYCGRLGWAAGGVAALGRGFRSPRELVLAHQVPQPPYGQGEAARLAGASALIDVSDGLLADLGHIADASGVEINLDSKAFEVPEPITRVAAATGADPLTFLLTGGEDYALAGCFSTNVPEGWVVIGEVREGSGVLVDGAEWDGSAGWDHFR